MVVRRRQRSRGGAHIRARTYDYGVEKSRSHHGGTAALSPRYQLQFRADCCSRCFFFFAPAIRFYAPPTNGSPHGPRIVSPGAVCVTTATRLISSARVRPRHASRPFPLISVVCPVCLPSVYPGISVKTPSTNIVRVRVCTRARDTCPESLRS